MKKKEFEARMESLEKRINYRFTQRLNRRDGVLKEYVDESFKKAEESMLHYLDASMRVTKNDIITDVNKVPAPEPYDVRTLDLLRHRLENSDARNGEIIAEIMEHKAAAQREGRVITQADESLWRVVL